MLELPFSGDGEYVIFQGNVQIFLLYARDFRLHGDVVLVFEIVDRRQEIF